MVWIDEGDNEIWVCVEDDGCGFLIIGKNKIFGLFGM